MQYRPDRTLLGEKIGSVHVTPQAVRLGGSRSPLVELRQSGLAIAPKVELKLQLERELKHAGQVLLGLADRAIARVSASGGPNGSTIGGIRIRGREQNAIG